MVIPPFLLKIRGLIGKITDALVAGRKAGLWSESAGPNISQRFMAGNLAEPQPILGGVKEKIKERIVEAGLNNVKAKIDTPEERTAIISGIHVPGIPTKYVWVLALFTGLGEMVLTALSTSDAHLLVTNWHAWLQGVVMSIDWSAWFHGVVTAIGAKFFLWLKEDSHNATAVVKTSTIATIAEIQKEIPA